MSKGYSIHSLTVQFHTFVKGCLLELCDVDSEIVELRVGDKHFDSPVAGSSRTGQTSIWFIPTKFVSAIAKVDVLLRTNDGLTKSIVLGLSPCLLGAAEWEILLTLSVGNERSMGWGLSVSPRLTLISSRLSSLSQKLPPTVYEICLEIRQTDRIPIQRKLSMITPLIRETIRKVFLAQTELENVRFADRPSEQFSTEQLIREIRRPELQLDYLNESAIECILKAIEEERRYAGKVLSKIREGGDTPGDWFNHAANVWPAAAPSLIASKLTTDEIINAGLVPLSPYMLLDNLVLSNESTLRVTNVPAGIALRVQINRSEQRVAEYGDVWMQNGRLDWLASQESRSDADYDDLIARHGTLS